MFIESLINEINDLISNAKKLYYDNLTKNPLLQARSYWTILKTFYNEKKNSLVWSFLIDDQFVTDL